MKDFINFVNVPRERRKSNEWVPNTGDNQPQVMTSIKTEVVILLFVCSEKQAGPKSSLPVFSVLCFRLLLFLTVVDTENIYT